MATALRLATYNIHSAVGLDRRFRPERIAQVLKEIDADVVALQEVESRDARIDLLPFFAEKLGYRAVSCTTYTGEHGPFGNGLLTRLPLVSDQRCDLSITGREPRALIDATLDWDGRPLRIFATHFGLSHDERVNQCKRVLEHLPKDDETPIAVMGDFNEWAPGASSLALLDGHFGAAGSVHTFPALLPVFGLDRIWAAPKGCVARRRAHRTRLAHIASDHLPLVADLCLA